jgi:hypothetical protein
MIHRKSHTSMMICIMRPKDWILGGIAKANHPKLRIHLPKQVLLHLAGYDFSLRNVISEPKLPLKWVIEFGDTSHPEHLSLQGSQGRRCAKKAIQSYGFWHLC